MGNLQPNAYSRQIPEGSACIVLNSFQNGPSTGTNGYTTHLKPKRGKVKPEKIAKKSLRRGVQMNLTRHPLHDRSNLQQTNDGRASLSEYIMEAIYTRLLRSVYPGYLQLLWNGKDSHTTT